MLDTLAGYTDGYLAGWFSCRWHGLQTGWLAEFLAFQIAGCLVCCMAGFLNEWFDVQLTGWLAIWLADCL